MTNRKELKAAEMKEINGGVIRRSKTDDTYLFEVWTDTNTGREIKTIRSNVADTADEAWIYYNEAERHAEEYAMKHHVSATLVSFPA